MATAPGTRDADVNAAPLTSPLETDPKGLLISRPWIRWLQQLFRGVQVAYDDAVEQAFDPDAARDIEPEVRTIAEQLANPQGKDIEPEVRRIAEQLANPPQDRARTDVQDLQRQFADADAPDASWRPRIGDLRTLAAQQEVNRPGSPLVWLADSHANRLSLYPAAAYPTGSRIFETDRKVTYIDVAGAWVYASGEMADVLANIPTGLGANDTGFLFCATDYRHTFRWNGSGWEFAPGDGGAGYFRDFAIAPAGAEAGAWQLCDGSATTYVTGDGASHAFTTPDLTGGTIRKGAAAGGYTGTVNAAGTATFTGNSVTPTGTVSQPTFTGTPATLTGTVSQPAFTGTPVTPGGTVSQPTFTGTFATTGDDNTTVNINDGSGVAMTLPYHTHQHTYTPAGTVSQPTFTGNSLTPSGTVSQPSLTMNSYTPAGTVSQPTFTGNPLTPSGTISFSSIPVSNIAVPVYFRR